MTVDSIHPTIRAAAVDEARRVCPVGSSMFDDLVQEGLIAGWQATMTAKFDPLTYARVAARNRVRTVFAGRAPMLGSVKARTDARDPMRLPNVCVPESERPEMSSGSSMGFQPPHFPLEFSAEVEEALDNLTERQKEIALMVADGEELHDAARKTWSSRVRPALRRSLSRRVHA